MKERLALLLVTAFTLLSGIPAASSKILFFTSGAGIGPSECLSIIECGQALSNPLDRPKGA